MADKPIFNTNKYGLITGEVHASNATGRPGVPIYPYADGSDDLANQKASIIGIQHIPSGGATYFKAFITQYNENFDSAWENTPVFGRPDPLYQFKNTQRSISIGWVVPAASLGEGIENLEKVQNFVRYMYPSYNTTNAGPDGTSFNALGMAAPPLIRLKFMNMLHNTRGAEATVTVGTPVDDRRLHNRSSTTTRPGRVTFDGTSADSGLLGYISNVSINHNVEGDTGVFHGIGAIVPKLIEIVIDFNPIHEEKLGWNMSTDPTKRTGAGDIPTGFGQFEATTVAYGGGRPASTQPSSFPYGMGRDFDPNLQQVTLDALKKSQADRIAQLQGTSDKEAARQIAQVRHSGFLGGMFKRADAKYYRKRMADPSKGRDSYRMAAGYAAADYPTDQSQARADIIAETERQHRLEIVGQGGSK
tara:strand:- start:35259 stop:36509 length:1251 start_codon:yes stop_codon:yes gene_type:complete